jgi:transposase
MHADQQAAGLEKRLRHAETQLASRTPSRGRGKRPITAEATLVEARALVLPEHRVDGLLSVAWEKQGEQTTQDVGRGRGAVHREKRVIEKTHMPSLLVVKPRRLRDPLAIRQVLPDVGPSGAPTI